MRLPAPDCFRRQELRLTRALLAVGLLAMMASCASAPKPVSTVPPAGQAPVPQVPSAAVAKAPPKAAPRAILLFSGAPGEALPPAIREALGERVSVPEGGAMSAAAQTIAVARLAMNEMRCSEVLAPLAQAADRVLGEALLPEARPLLGELYGLLLLCADRVNDVARAESASAALRAMQATLPADVARLLSRYETPQPFGPPRAPVHIETDPPGAVVLRNLIPVGQTPIDVPGGQPERDFMDVELPGFRKQHRPLGSNQQLVLALRPEDRLPVLFDRAALFAAGSDGQEAVLHTLAETAGAKVLPSHLLLVLGPRQLGGTRMIGEPLAARIYDLERKAWLGPTSEVPAGPAATQAQALIALCESAAMGRTGPGPAIPPAAVAQKAAPPPKSKLPFANTKWYTWVIAGGVAALIAGLLIAEKVSPEKITISANR